MKETTSTRLQRILSERGLKQVDVLERAVPYCKEYGIKLNKSDLSQYVSGKVEPGQDKLTVLGLALNVSEAWLMGFDVPMERNSANDTVRALWSAALPAVSPSRLKKILKTMWTCRKMPNVISVCAARATA